MPITFPPPMNQDGASVEAGILRYHIEYTSGAAGAVPATLTRAKGIASIVRSGAGIFVITLIQPAVDFVDFVAFNEQATPANTGACIATVVDSVNTSPAILTVTWRKNSDYTAVDPANGDIIYYSFSVLTIKQ